ncbi:MAG: hypothetical protein ACD_58C00219G0002 [uncultured bacterium]|nr:MAG: hypothetical protein ACD_58C00219G0002 [uncultured bacterium]
MKYLQKYIKDKYTIYLLLIFFITLLLFLRAWVVADGVSYYSYLPTLFYDHNLSFLNEFKFFSSLPKPWIDFNQEFFMRNGDVLHFFSVGPAVLALPFYLIVWLVVNFLGIFGFNISGSHLDFLPYLLSFNLAAAFYSFLGLILSYKLASKFFSKVVSFWAVLCLWLGGSTINYMFFEGSNSHAFTLFGVVLFIYYWWDTYGKRSTKQWLALGLLGGLMSLTRWQEVLFLVLPLMEWLWLLFKDKKVMLTLKNGLVFLFGVIIAFSPQMIVWKILYGKYITIPHGMGFLQFDNPHFWEVLFSSRHGLISWTPIVALALTGLFLLYKKQKNLAVYLLLGLLMQFYINSLAADWWGAFAFGQRRFIDSILIFVLGLAAFYSWLESHGKIMLAKIISIIFVVWNILFLVQYRAHLIDGFGYISWVEMIKNQYSTAPINFVKLLGQSSFLVKLQSGIVGGNWLDIFSALGILLSYILIIYVLVIVIRKISFSENSKS